MKKQFIDIESRGLPGGPNEVFSYITGVFSIDGYKSDSPDVNNPFNIIPSADITMKGVDFPVRGYGNNGIVQDMKPGGNYNYGDADYVFEVPMAQEGLEQRGKRQIDFMTNWANSSMHNQMLDSSSTSDKFKDKVKRARRNFDNVNIADEEVDGFLGQYINGQITMNPSALKEHVIGNDYDNVLVHELSHFTDDGNPDNKGQFNKSNIPLSDRRLIKDYSKQGIKRAKSEEKELNELLKSENMNPNDKDVIKDRVKRLKYLGDPTETRSRINATRYFYENDKNFGRSSERNIDKNLPSIFDSEVTPDMIKVMEESGQYKQLQEIYTDEQILEMFNTISYSETPERSFDVLNARYGKELPMAQTGIEVPKRQGVRKNPDGTESTHLMATETLDGKNWFSFPTLFQDPDGTWVDMSNKPWKEAYEEAKKRGELIDFGTNKETAIKFGEGSWKPKMKRGGGLLTKTMKCNSCGWKWKAADGGNDVTTCHKCGGEALPTAQKGIELPKAQKGLGWLKPYAKQGLKYLDDFVENSFKEADNAKNFEFKNLPTIEKKQFIKVVDGEFDTINYDHLIPTTQEISDIAKRTRSRLMSDKFIKNNMEATGRSKDEVVGYIDDYIKEFENSTLAFDKTRDGSAGLYTRGKITIDPRSPHLTKENVLGTLEHEIEHMFSNVGQQGSDLYRHPKFKLVDRTGMPDENLVQNMSQAFEQQVRFRKALGWLEKNAGLKVGDDVTDEQVEALTDAIVNWSKEGGKDFRGSGANFDIQHLFSNLDAEQFLKPGQYLMPNAPRTANLKNSNVRKGIKDILNKTYSAAAVGGLGAASQIGPVQEDNQFKDGGWLDKFQEGGNVATISAYEEPAWYEKAVDYLASPMTAFGYSARNQDLPDSIPISAENRSSFDGVIDMINPFAWAKYAASAKRNVDQGEYLDAGFDALGAIPIVPAWLAKGKNVAKNLPVDKLDDLVEVVTTNGSIKKIPRKDAIRLSRVEDANVTNTSFNNYEDGNWFADKPSEFYVNRTKNAMSPVSYDMLEPGDPRRLITMYMDPSDAKNFNLIKGSPTERALNMSGGMGNMPHPKEYVLPPALVKQIRETGKIPGGSTFIGNADDVMKNLSDFYKKYGGDIGELDQAQLGAFLKSLKPAIKKVPLDKLQDGNGEYQVKKGDTFYGIANRNNISWDKLKEANPNLNIDKLSLGQKLIVPGYKSPEPLVENKPKKEFNPYKDIDSTSQERRFELDKALKKVASLEPENKNLYGNLLMVAAMENSYGANPDSYKRAYTRGPMSIDDIAYKDLFEPRGENNKYLSSQKNWFNYLSDLGFDYTKMDKTLRSNDPLAGVAAARIQYGRTPEALPDVNDPDAMYNYYMKYYNRTEADHKERFMGWYNELLKDKEYGGDPSYNVYKKFMAGGFISKDEEKEAEKVYDKLNRIHYSDAKSLGMSPANYIMTHIIRNS